MTRKELIEWATKKIADLAFVAPEQFKERTAMVADEIIDAATRETLSTIASATMKERLNVDKRGRKLTSK